MVEWLNFLVWFCFEQGHSPDVPRPAAFAGHHYWDVLAFGNIAALGFVCFVVLDIILNFVQVYGPATGITPQRSIARSARFWVAILLGTIASFVVAILASVFNILQINVQSALITGLTWQVVYARLVAQMNATAQALPQRPAPGAGDVQVAKSEEDGA